MVTSTGSNLIRYRPGPDMREIKLTQGEVAQVDNEDYEYLNQWNWHTAKGYNTFYAVRHEKTVNGKRPFVRMHRKIMSPLPGKDIDHRDNNGLNNQKNNLRECNDCQNQMNQRMKVGFTSRFKGVSWFKKYGKWRASIGFKRKFYHLGFFPSELDAADAYNQKAQEFFGEFAKLNVLGET